MTATTQVALDFCLSHRLVGALQELYGHHGYKFIYLRDIVEGKTKDEVWAETYKKFGGHIVLSGDCQIAFRPHQAIAFIDNGFSCFFPAGAWGKLRANEKAAMIIYWWPCIEEKIKSGVDGTCWRIPCNAKKSELHLKLQPLEQLVIPNEILEEARKAREAA